MDVLHQRAGAQRVYGVHGSWLTSRCLKCSTDWKTVEAVFPDLEKSRGKISKPRKNPDKIFQALEKEIPRCACGGILKPDITFFGEELPQTTWYCAMEAMIHAELVLVLGTSLAVFPAAALPHYRDRKARLVIINREATALDAEADAVLRGDLPELMQQITDRAFQA